MPARIWLDLETTGLDPTAGFILELAVVATEPEAPAYRELAAQSWLILPADAGWLGGMDEVAATMHAKSGLLQAVVEDGRPVREVEAELVKFLSFFGNPAPGRESIAGSSPHFDYGWLKHHLPTAARYFNDHRCFDASTLKRFALDHGCASWDAGDGSGGAAHRALADVRYSIETARTVSRLLATR